MEVYRNLQRFLKGYGSLRKFAKAHEWIPNRIPLRPLTPGRVE